MYTGRSRTGRSGGQYTRENAGISSESVARNHAVESLRVPGEGSSTQGKSGTKSRSKDVDDVQPVDIPVPPRIVDEAVTQKDSQAAKMENCGQIVRLTRSEVRVLRLGYDVE